MAIKIEMLRCFSVVAQAGSLVDAADRLGRTPSAVSMTLKQLEEHLGQRLFESDRKSKLTRLGEFVFEQAQNEIRQFDNAIAAIESYALSSAGLIRVAAVPSIAGWIYPKTVELFQKKQPGVRLELRDMDSAGILQSMVRGMLDVGIASIPKPPRDVRSAPLFSDAFGLVCTRNHPLAKRTEPPRIEDLGKHGFIANDLCRSIQVPEFQELLIHTNISAPNTLSLLAMLKSGKFVTVLPRAVVGMEPNTLVLRPLSDLNERRNVSVLFKTTPQSKAYIADFVHISTGVARGFQTD